MEKIKPKYSQREYKKHECAVFRKTKEQYGCFSNMASAFPLKINNLEVKSSEALYQALKFPNDPEIQIKILIEKNPFNAKMVSRKYNEKCRRDWDNIKVKIMDFCLRLKLAQHYDSFGKTLKESYPMPIVEYSPTDAFWGATSKDNILVGTNALGRLLMQLRADMMENNKNIFEVEIPDIENFKLLDKDVKI